MDLVFDIETDDLKATKVWCIVAQDVDTNEIFKFPPKKLQDGYDLLMSADTLIGHNIIGFDIPMVETLFLELYHSGRYDVLIKRFGYSDFTFTVEAARSSIYQANTPIVEEVITKQVPIYNLGSETTATINAIDPIPSAITGYSFRGHYNKRGIQTLR